MNLVRWDPVHELAEMTDRLNRVFGRTNGRRDNDKEWLAVAEWSPDVDITETDTEYHLQAELPGLDKGDVKITLEDGVVTLQGERKQEKEEKGKRFHRVERSYGRFVRSFALPDSVDETKVSAEFKQGVLHVRLPKSEKAKPKQIEVSVK